MKTRAWVRAVPDALVQVLVEHAKVGESPLLRPEPSGDAPAAVWLVGSNANRMAAPFMVCLRPDGTWYPVVCVEIGGD